jgi:hypothetical protein
VVAHEAPGALLLPIGHYVGSSYRAGRANAPRQVRRAATCHELSDEQFAVWVAAHGTASAVNSTVGGRVAVEEHLRETGLDNVDELVAQLTDMHLLVEVEPGGGQAIEFAKSHRLVPLMLGLGNSVQQPDMFGIGFLHQPVLQVSHAIYDLWQWCAMDDALWATCQNAADVARRAGFTDPGLVDPEALLTGLLGSLHALLISSAAYLDMDFRLDWPDTTPAALSSDTRSGN